MLNHVPENRATLDEVMAHPYFAGIDWDSVRQRKGTRKFASISQSCRVLTCI